MLYAQKPVLAKICQNSPTVTSDFSPPDCHVFILMYCYRMLIHIPKKVFVYHTSNLDNHLEHDYAVYRD